MASLLKKGRRFGGQRPYGSPVITGTKDQHGFTLLEVLIALTVLSIGILMLTGMQFSTVNANTNGFKMSTAVSLGEGLMERLKILAPIDPLLIGGVYNAPITIPTVGGTTYLPATVNGITYSGSYTVIDNTPVVGLKRIDLTVTWVDTRNHSLTFTGRVPMP